MARALHALVLLLLLPLSFATAQAPDPDLPPGRGGLVGFVRDGNGSPLDGMEVRVEFHGQRFTTTSGPDGWYRLEVPDGAKEPKALQTGPRPDGVFVSTTGECDENGYCFLANQGYTAWKNFTMVPGGAVTGRITLHDGSTTAGLIVSFGETSTTTDDQGRYWLTAWARREPLLVAAPRNPVQAPVADDHHAEVELVLNETLVHDVRLPPPTMIRGYVRFADAAPATGATVTSLGYLPTGGETHEGWAKVGADGAYALAVLPALHAPHVSAKGGPYAGGHVACDLTFTDGCVPVERGATAWHNVTLRPGGTLAVTVLDPTGQEMTHGFRLVVRGENDLAAMDGGHWRLRDRPLLPGDYSLHIIPDADLGLTELRLDCSREEDCIRLVEGQHVTRTVQLARAPTAPGDAAHDTPIGARESSAVPVVFLVAAVATVALARRRS